MSIFLVISLTAAFAEAGGGTSSDSSGGNGKKKIQDIVSYANENLINLLVCYSN